MKLIQYLICLCLLLISCERNNKIIADFDSENATINIKQKDTGD